MTTLEILSLVLFWLGVAIIAFGLVLALLIAASIWIQASAYRERDLDEEALARELDAYVLGLNHGKEAA